MQKTKVFKQLDLHLCESLSAALALAAASLLVVVEPGFPLPALMEALFTCPWLIPRALGVASGPGAGDTAATLAPFVPFSAAFSEDSAATPLLAAPVVEVRLEIGG